MILFIIIAALAVALMFFGSRPRLQCNKNFMNSTFSSPRRTFRVDRRETAAAISPPHPQQRLRAPLVLNINIPQASKLSLNCDLRFNKISKSCSSSQLFTSLQTLCIQTLEKTGCQVRWTCEPCQVDFRGNDPFHFLCLPQPGPHALKGDDTPRNHPGDWSSSRVGMWDLKWVDFLLNLHKPWISVLVWQYQQTVRLQFCWLWHRFLSVSWK